MKRRKIMPKARRRVASSPAAEKPRTPAAAARSAAAEELRKIKALALAGVSRLNVEATIGRALKPGEVTAFRAAATVRQLQAAKARRERADGTAAMTATERQRKKRADDRDIASRMPFPADVDTRESCRHDLLKFGLTYGRAFIRRPPSELMAEFIRQIEAAIVRSGKCHIRWPRGKGKTSWLKIGLLWAVAYGYRRFAVVIAATQADADRIMGEVLRVIQFDESFAADFPELSFPLVALEGNAQRAKYQTYEGRPTFVMANSAQHLYRLATIPTRHAAGAIIAARGVGSAVRGIALDGVRPDFVFIDDPQKKEDAKSQARVNDVEEFIVRDVMPLAGKDDEGHDIEISAAMASTPIEADDVSERFADAARHPEWITESRPLVIRWPKRQDLVDVYFEHLREDIRARDLSHARAFAWYRKFRKDIEDGVEMLDPADGTKDEVSSFHHALNLMFSLGSRAAFDAEYQLKPRRATFALDIRPATVLKRIVPGAAPATAIPNAVLTVAATDINPSYAITTTVVTFDIRRTCRLFGYRIFPCKIDTSQNDTAFHQAVYTALTAAAKELAALMGGRKLDAWGVDGSGQQSAPVKEFTINSKALCGLEALAMYGRAATRFNPFVKSRVANEVNRTIRCIDSERIHEYLYWDADLYKEAVHKAILTETGAPGGFTLFDGGVDHAAFAEQVANEKLVGKRDLPDGRTFYAWKTREPHDIGDCLAMCYALAAARGLTGDGSFAAAESAPAFFAF